MEQNENYASVMLEMLREIKRLNEEGVQLAGLLMTKRFEIEELKNTIQMQREQMASIPMDLSND